MNNVCWKCNGTGKYFDPNVTNIQTCSVCSGSGYLDENKTVSNLRKPPEYQEGFVDGYKKGKEEIIQYLAKQEMVKAETKYVCTLCGKRLMPIEPLGDDLSVSD